MASQQVSITSAGSFSQDTSGNEWYFGAVDGSAGSTVDVFSSPSGPGPSTTMTAVFSGFSIPSTATIDGVVLSFDSRIDTGSQTLVVNVSGGTQKSSTAPATGSFVATTFGSSTDKWGRSWTPSQINSGISATLKVTPTGEYLRTRTTRWKLTVHYTEEVPPESVPPDDYEGPFTRMWNGTEWVYVKPLVYNGSRFAEPPIYIQS